MNHLISPNLVDSKPKSTAASRGSSRSSSRTNDAGNSYRDELTSLMDQKSKSSSPSLMLQLNSGKNNIIKETIINDGVVNHDDRKLMVDYPYYELPTMHVATIDLEENPKNEIKNEESSEAEDEKSKTVSAGDIVESKFSSKVDYKESTIKYDINNDGKVDDMDAALLSRFLHKSYSIYIDESKSDFNNDGKISKDDLEELEMILKKKIKGDVNGDGKLTLTDIAMLERSFIGLKKLSREELERGDMNSDGKITLTDIAKLEQKYLGYDNPSGIIGDANNDGKIDYIDIYKIKKLITMSDESLDNIPYDKFNGIKEQADLDGDKEITFYDLFAIEKYINNYSNIKILKIKNKARLYNDKELQYHVDTINKDNYHNLFSSVKVIEETKNAYKILIQLNPEEGEREYWIEKKSILSDYTKTIDEIVETKMGKTVKEVQIPYRKSKSELEKEKENELKELSNQLVTTVKNMYDEEKILNNIYLDSIDEEKSYVNEIPSKIKEDFAKAILEALKIDTGLINSKNEIEVLLSVYGTIPKMPHQSKNGTSGYSIDGKDFYVNIIGGVQGEVIANITWDNGKRVALRWSGTGNVTNFINGMKKIAKKHRNQIYKAIIKDSLSLLKGLTTKDSVESEKILKETLGSNLFEEISIAKIKEIILSIPGVNNILNQFDKIYNEVEEQY